MVPPLFELRRRHQSFDLDIVSSSIILTRRIRLNVLSISITGFVVLGGGIKSIPDPGKNFRNAFEGTTGDASGIVRALVRVNYAYEGYANAFNVVNEIKVCALAHQPQVVPLTD